MTEEQKRRLDEELDAVGTDTGMEAEQEGDGKKSIGLKNIAERIRLHYGQKYYLKVLRSGKEGTCIEIFVPLIKNNG